MIYTSMLRKVLSTVLVLGGILILSYPPFSHFNSLYEQKKQRMVLSSDTAVNSENADALNSINKETDMTAKQEKIFEGAIIEATSINLSAAVFSGTIPEVLKKGPGWYEQSSLPGEGNTAIAGHRTMYGGWFRALDRLRTGDIIILKYKSITYTYTVEKTFSVGSNDWSILDEDGSKVLTLTTCISGTYNKRFVVKARMNV